MDKKDLRIVFMGTPEFAVGSRAPSWKEVIMWWLW